MHRHALGVPASDNSKGTTVRNSCAAPATQLLSLVGGLGVLPQSARIHVDRTPTVVTLVISMPAGRTDVPDSPPPRA